MTGVPFRWSPVLVFKIIWLVLNLSFSPGVAGHVKHNPSLHDRAIAPLTDLTPEEPDFNSFALDGALYNPSKTYTPLPSLPSSCSSIHKECPTLMRAVNVTYDDCLDSWTMCHCSSANISLDDAVERLGKVPVGLRKYIAMTVVLPAQGDDVHAYTLTNGDIYFFGDLDMNTWVHEAAHAYDYAFGDPFSGSQQWLDAIEKDTCATDDYGITNAAEEFAQSNVLKMYSLIYGSLPPGWNANCMSHQQDYLSTLPLYNKTTLFGDTCASSSSISPSKDRPSVVRPIKSNGPLSNLNAPLRMNPKANSTVPSSSSSGPPAVTNSPIYNKNSALPSGGSTWTLSLAIIFVMCSR